MSASEPKEIPPPGFVAKLPPVGAVFTDPDNPPGPGWLWSDEADPPRWLPPDASSPHFAQAIEDARKDYSPPPGFVAVGQMTDEAVAKATPQCWTRQYCDPDGAFNEDKYAAGFNACVESSPSPPPQGLSDEQRERIRELENKFFQRLKESGLLAADHPYNAKPDPQGQDRGQGEGEPTHKCNHCHRLFHGYAQYWGHKCKPAPQSAEEWAKATWDTMWKSVNFSWTEVMSKLIEPLARRCDEAEARAHNFEQGFHIHSARADEAEKPGWRQACMQIGMKLAPITQSAGVVEAVEEVVAQLAAAQAESKSLAHDLANMHDEVCRLTAQLAAAQAELTRLQHENTAHRVAWENAEARERELRGIAGEAISAMASVRTDRIHETESDIWALQTLEWAEWLLERAEHLSAALAKKEAQP